MNWNIDFIPHKRRAKHNKCIKLLFLNSRTSILPSNIECGENGVKINCRCNKEELLCEQRTVQSNDRQYFVSTIVRNNIPVLIVVVYFITNINSRGNNSIIEIWTNKQKQGKVPQVINLEILIW